MPVQEKILDLLVCPACLGKLIYKKYEVIEDFGSLATEATEGSENLIEKLSHAEKEAQINSRPRKNKKMREELWCKFDKLAYLIKQDIPIMLVEEARTLSLEELDQCK